MTYNLKRFFIRKWQVIFANRDRLQPEDLIKMRDLKRPIAARRCYISIFTIAVIHKPKHFYVRR